MRFGLGAREGEDAGEADWGVTGALICNGENGWDEEKEMGWPSD